MKTKVITVAVVLLMTASVLLPSCSALKSPVACFSSVASGQTLVQFGGLPNLVTGDAVYMLGTGSIILSGRTDVGLIESFTQTSPESMTTANVLCSPFSAQSQETVSPANGVNMWSATGNCRIRESRVFASCDDGVFRVKLTAAPNTAGIFTAEGPYSGAYVLGGAYTYLPSPPQALWYSGTFTDASGTHNISGYASFFVDVGIVGESGITWLMGVVLLNPDLSTFAVIYWVSQDAIAYISATETLPINAATIFSNYVKIV